MLLQKDSYSHGNILHLKTGDVFRMARLSEESLRVAVFTISSAMGNI